MSGSKTGLIFAHSVDNNFARWRYTPRPSSISSTRPISIDGQDVFVVDNAGNYVMLETQTGRPISSGATTRWATVTTAPPAVQGSEVHRRQPKTASSTRSTAPAATGRLAPTSGPSSR